MNKIKTKKTIGKILNGISVVVVLICLVLVVFSTVSLARNHFVRVFGYSLHLVVTDSMTPEILVDDLVVAQKTNKENIKVGDDIVFISDDPILRGNMVVHRVVKIEENGAFRTQGVKIGAPIDSYPVYSPLGKVVAVNTSVGKVFKVIVEYRIFIFILLLLILTVIIISEAISVKFTLKAQKLAEKEEKEKIRKEIEGDKW